MPYPGLSRREALRRLRVYEETESDGDAAHALGISVPTFQHWRDRNGLPKKFRAQGYYTTPHFVEEVELWSAYLASGSDVEAAQSLGMRFEKFKKWRWRRGLPSRWRSDERAVLDLAAAWGGDVDAARRMHRVVGELLRGYEGSARLTA